MASSEPYRNVVGLSPEKLKELLANFEKLKDFGVELYDRAVRYVLDGDDECVLGELAGKTDAAHALGLICVRWLGPRTSQAHWGKFLSVIEPVGHHFYLRLGRVFEAAARSLPAGRFFCQKWFEKALWLEILLQEATGRSVQVYGGQKQPQPYPPH